MEGTQEGIFIVNSTNQKNNTDQDGLPMAVTVGFPFNNPLCGNNSRGM
jgi:hypothetical protein